MAFVWTQDLAVGVPAIDNQHKELFVRIDALLNAMSLGKGKDEVGKVVGFLEDYVVEHFGAEEKLMANSRYPKMTAHKALHSSFVSDFMKIKAALNDSGPSSALVIETKKSVVDWLKQHISETDKVLGAHLKAN